MVSFVQKDRLTFFIKNAFIPIYPVSTIYSSQIDNDIILKKINVNRRKCILAFQNLNVL